MSLLWFWREVNCVAIPVGSGRLERVPIASPSDARGDCEDDVDDDRVGRGSLCEDRGVTVETISSCIKAGVTEVDVDEGDVIIGVEADVTTSEGASTFSAQLVNER